jgi:L-lysine 6-transaminase
VREVKNNVFEEKSRINSTWGGNLVDFVRSQKYLEIIRDESLVENAASTGNYLLERLKSLGVENVRGAGLMCSFDMSTSGERDAVVSRCLTNGLFLLGCGQKSVRVRPSLTFTQEECDLLIELLKKSL